MRTMIVIQKDVLLKSQVKGYTKKDGTVVKPYSNKTGHLVAPKKGGHKLSVPSQGSLFGGSSTPKTYGHHGSKFSGMVDKMYPQSSKHPKAPPKPKAYHPQSGEDGQRIGLFHPHTATKPKELRNPESVTTITPGGKVVKKLNGVRLRTWKGAPTTEAGWAEVSGQIDLEEPPLPESSDPKFKKKAASGVIVEEPDGRVWVISPTNQFGGYQNSYPKGKQDEGLSLQANAIKECFEESGLQIEITGFLGDIERTTSVARYYRAKRVGGTPADMGWETQAVHLVPGDLLRDFMDQTVDKDVADMLGGRG